MDNPNCQSTATLEDFTGDASHEKLSYPGDPPPPQDDGPAAAGAGLFEDVAGRTPATINYLAGYLILA